MKNKITQKEVDNIIENSKIDVKTVFDKVTVVTCKLPNGFVLVESSGAVDKSSYDKEIGKQICMDRIESKIWELEGYHLAKVIQQGQQSASGSLYGMMSATPSPFNSVYR